MPSSPDTSSQTDASPTSQVKRLLERAWYWRGRFPLLSLPIPVRLPYGGWFLAYGDGMGARVAGYALSRRGYEAPKWRFTDRLLGPGDVFADVGANQGFYTILAAKRVGRGGHVYAFEPADTERKKLLCNLWLNRLTNVTVEATAIGRTKGRTAFHLCLDHQGSWSSIRPPAEDVVARRILVEVPITTLDDYLIRSVEVDRVDLIKVDVEGGELDVLRGAQEVLARFRPALICEVEDRRTERWGYLAAEILRVVESSGYSWFGIAPDGGLVEADVNEPSNWQDLAALPSERAERIARRVS